MARAYDVAVSALALGVERKWLDNLTSQHTIPGTEHVARGVPRRLAMQALVTAAIVRDLNRGLGVSVARAIELAGAVRARGPGESWTNPDLIGTQAAQQFPPEVVLAIGDSVTLTIDAALIEQELERRLVTVMETTVPRRRGRPPRKERRGTR